MLRPDRSDSVSLGRFLREAKALARLSHPNVVQVHDVHSIDGRIYRAMEYVQGRTLREAVAREPQVVALAAREPAWQRLLAPALATHEVLKAP